MASVVSCGMEHSKEKNGAWPISGGLRIPGSNVDPPLDSALTVTTRFPKATDNKIDEQNKSIRLTFTCKHYNDDLVLNLLASVKNI
jgi:hypothetical protein